MANRTIYGVVAVLGIAAASGAAYWYQNKPKGPQEMGQGVAASTGSSAAAPAAGGGGAARGPGGPAGVEVAKVEKTTLQDDAQSVGTLRSRQTVLLRPEVSGRVAYLGFSDGARVRKGQVLVQLDDVLQRAEVQQAQAQVSIQRANLRRNQELVAQNFVAQRVLDESAANVQVAEAQMALACARLERMRILAPFDATAGIRNVNLGDFVKDGADLVNLEDLSAMFVDFRLPERFQTRIRNGQVVELQLDALPGRSFKAKVDAIDPQLDANGRSVLVRASLPNTGGEPLARQGGAEGGARASPGAAGGSTGAGNPAAANPGAAAQAAGAASAPAKAAAPRANPAASAARAPGAGGQSAAPPSAEAQACAALARSGASVGGNAGGARQGAAGGAAGAQRPAGANTTARPDAAPAAANAQRGASPRPGAAATDGRGGGGAGGGPLRPGMFARVTAVFQVKDAALTVPEEAIVPQAGRQFVIKVVEQTEEEAKALAAQAAASAAAAPQAAAAGAAPNAAPGVVQAAPAASAPTGFVDGRRLVSKRQEVRLGIRRQGRVEIVDGVSEGEQVVIAGQQRLQRDATPVRIVELGRAPGAGQGGASGGGGAAGAGAASGSGAAAAAANPAAPASR
jgi:membrane fusion protein, multidrug efflux system